MKDASVPSHTTSIQSLNWPFLNIRITSNPLIVACADFIDWKPSVGLIKRFTFPWSPYRRLLPARRSIKDGGF
jgi:hypothetical protein